VSQVVNKERNQLLLSSHHDFCSQQGRILAASRVEEVIGEFVNLKKRGHELHRALPFHTEKTLPSMSHLLKESSNASAAAKPVT